MRLQSFHGSRWTFPNHLHLMSVSYMTGITIFFKWKMAKVSLKYVVTYRTRPQSHNYKATCEVQREGGVLLVSAVRSLQTYSNVF